MVRFYTPEFFEELERRLSVDREWLESLTGHSIRIVCSAFDRKASVLIAIEDRNIRVESAKAGTPAGFRFEGSYDTWVRLCRGDADFEELVQTAKIRVAGSIPELQSLSGPLNHIVRTARSLPKTF